MAKKNNKKTDENTSGSVVSRDRAPVASTLDVRAEERSRKTGNKKRHADAPDGVSGNWS